MKSQLVEEKNVKKLAKIAIKTLIDCFVGLMLIICFIFVLFPKFSLKMHQSLGMEKVQEYDYQLIFDRTNNIADLYNVIIYEEFLGKTKKELGYLNEILVRDDYYEFCDAMDEATIKRLNDKKLIASSANVNGYLAGRKVYCLYSLGSKNVQSFVYEQTKNGKFKEYSYAVYVDLVNGDDSLTAEQKKTIFKELMLLQTVDTENKKLVSTEDLVENKIDGLKSLIAVTTNENEKLVLKYVLMRYYSANATLYGILGDEEKQTENSNLYNSLKLEIE